MIKLAPLYIAFLCSVSHTAVYALDLLDDKEMSQATGQDGVTISLDLGTRGAITFDHAVIEDRDGISSSTTHNNAAGFAYVTQGSGKGISFHNGTSLIAKPLSIEIDADGNNASPVMNIALKFAPNLSKIKLDAFTIGLVKMGSNFSIDANSRRDIIKTGANGIDINLNAANPLGVNLQLGNQPQDALFKFVGSINSINADDLEILSYQCSGATCTSTAGHSMKFDFELKANESSTNGIRLNNLTGNLNNDGLVVTNTGTLDKVDINLTGITFGNLGDSSTSHFDSLKNGSIGNIGLEGIAVKDFKMSVKGL